jgi:hypothetical protein
MYTFSDTAQRSLLHAAAAAAVVCALGLYVAVYKDINTRVHKQHNSDTDKSKQLNTHHAHYYVHLRRMCD